PGANPLSLTIAPGTEAHVSFPAGSIGGPVKVSSTVPVLASQRVQYYQSFNEVAGAGPALAKSTIFLMWFDTATAGMVGDNIHILNPGTVMATVTVTLPGKSPIVANVEPRAETHVSFPARGLGGRVGVTATHPLLAGE